MSETHYDDVIWYREKRPEYEELAERVEKILTEILNIEKINYAVIQSRAKSIDSFQNRIKEIDFSGKELVDLAGVRVVGYVITDVDKIIQTIKNNFKVDEKTDKSAELGPDRFGYRAIHLICELPNERIVLPEYKKFKDMIFEIQVKTILEHAWAEIEHDRNYKYKALPKDIQRDFYLISGSLEVADKQFDQITKRIEEYDKEIKLKTEQGKLEEININPATLKRYLIGKFSGKIPMEQTYGGTGTGEGEVNELLSMGVKNLFHLEQIIPPNFVEIEKAFLEIKHLSRGFAMDTNLSGLVFAILMIKFGNGFCKEACKSRTMTIEKFKEYLADYQQAVAKVEKK